MASSKAREAWINAYNEWVNHGYDKEAVAAAAAEIDAVVKDLVEPARKISDALEQLGINWPEISGLRAAIKGWEAK